MTPTEVKQAHDEIWAVRKKIDLCSIDKYRAFIGWNIHICYVKKAWTCKTFKTKSEVNQFLKEIE